MQATEAAYHAAVHRATAAAEAAQHEAALLRERTQASLLRCNSLELRACPLLLPVLIPVLFMGFMVRSACGHVYSF